MQYYKMKLLSVVQCTQETQRGEHVLPFRNLISPSLHTWSHDDGKAYTLMIQWPMYCAVCSLDCHMSL